MVGSSRKEHFLISISLLKGIFQASPQSAIPNPQSGILLMVKLKQLDGESERQRK